MQEVLKKSILELLDDLSDTQISRLVYVCLECPVNEIAQRRKVTKQAVAYILEKINKKRNHQEIIAALQEALSKGGFML